jgi:hypothetical protein
MCSDDDQSRPRWSNGTTAIASCRGFPALVTLLLGLGNEIFHILRATQRRAIGPPNFFSPGSLSARAEARSPALGDCPDQRSRSEGGGGKSHLKLVPSVTYRGRKLIARQYANEWQIEIVPLRHGQVTQTKTFRELAHAIDEAKKIVDGDR